MQIKKIKQWLAPLRRTPLHPQWLIRKPITRTDLVSFAGLTVDIGCAGSDVQQLLPESAEYIGIDYYETAINWYQTRPHLFSDAHSLSLASTSVDNAVMLHVLEHLGRPQLALEEIFRVLKPGGQLLVEVPFLYPVHDAPLDFHRWTQFGLAGDLEAVGFEVVQSSSIGRATETAAILFNLAISRLTLDWLARRSLWLLTAPVLWGLIPILNLIGCVLAPGHSTSDFMPHRIRVLCRKKA